MTLNQTVTKVVNIVDEVELKLVWLSNLAIGVASTVDPHRLPMKEAAVVVAGQNALVLFQRTVLKVKNATPSIEAAVEHFAEDPASIPDALINASVPTQEQAAA